MNLSDGVAAGGFFRFGGMSVTLFQAVKALAERRKQCGKSVWLYPCQHREQNEDRQILALKELAIPEKNLFMDKQSGKDFERPQYRKMVRKLKKTICSTSRASIVWAEIILKFWSSGGF